MQAAQRTSLTPESAKLNGAGCTSLPKLDRQYAMLPELYDAFSGPNEATRRQAAARYASRLAAEGGDGSPRAWKAGRGWRFSILALLPSGETVGAYLARQGGDARESRQAAELAAAAGIGDLSSGQRQVLADKLALLHAFKQGIAENLTQQQSADRVKSECGDALDRIGVGQKRGLLATLRNWRKRFERDGLLGLRDKRGRAEGDGASPCDPPAWDYFCGLYLAGQQRSVALCHELTAAEAARQRWAWPSLPAVRRLVRKHLPRFHSDLPRLGEKAWRDKHCPVIDLDHSDLRPHQRWVGDHVQLDFWTWLDRPRGECKLARCWLSVWIDAASRLIVGFDVTLRPDTDSLLAAFAMGCRLHGVPEEIQIDNGKDYRSQGFSGGRRKREPDKRFASVAEQLGVRVKFTRTYSPQSKGIIESFFASMHEGFCKLFPSYCGRDAKSKPEGVQAKVVAGEIPAPRSEQVEALFSAHLEAYHARFHSGLNGRAPSRAVTENPIARRTLPDELLRLLLRKTARAKVTRRGVRYRGLHYGWGDARLYKYSGEDVLLRIDPKDPSSVTICELGGRVICEAFCPQAADASVADVKAMLRRQREAKRLAESAMPALRDSTRSVGELLYDLTRLRRMKAAAVGTGTDGARSVALITTPAVDAVRGVTIADSDGCESERAPGAAIDRLGSAIARLRADEAESEDVGPSSAFDRLCGRGGGSAIARLRAEVAAEQVGFDDNEDLG